MKNYLIGTLAVIIVLLISIVYKQQNIIMFSHFPVQEPEEMRGKSTEASLYLILFFSKKNCASCLDEIVKVLNDQSPPFYVLGVVPESELEDEQALRGITKAAFPLSSLEKYRNYAPVYTPTLIGVSPSGKVVFVLPGDTMQSRRLDDFFNSVYSQLYHLLGDEKSQDKKGEEAKKTKMNIKDKG
jgi:hypothetical protein